MLCSAVQCSAVHMSWDSVLPIYGNIEQQVNPKTNFVLKPQNLLKSYTMLNGESQTCRMWQVVKLHWGGSATNGATPSSFTGAPLNTAGTKLDLCL